MVIRLDLFVCLQLKFKCFMYFSNTDNNNAVNVGAYEVIYLEDGYKKDSDERYTVFYE